MSTLDKAFIKAYQRHGVSGPHLPFGRQRPPAPADAPVHGASVGSAIPTPHVSAQAADAIADRDPAADETAQVESLKPAFEIERFTWPELLPALVDHRRLEMSALLNELLPLAKGLLAVGGCRRGEGRTTVSLVVARQLAVQGARVVLVDADTQRPKLAETLGTAVEIGWQETLAARQSPCEAMIESLADRLAILPLKKPVEDAALADRGDDLKQMLQRLRSAFDVVCLDLGPSVESHPWQASLFESGLNAAVVVRDIRYSRLEQAQAVGRKFADGGAAHWTIIENFV